MKKVFLLIIGIILINLSGCSKIYEDVKDVAQKDIDSFLSGNMTEIGSIIFGKNKFAIDMEKKAWGSNSESILSTIFSHSTMSVKKVKEDTVVLSVTAPNMEKVFEYAPDSSYARSKDGFLEYIEDYVEVTEQKKFRVSVAYTIEEEKIIIDYCNEEFINAITGGLPKAYKQLYEEALYEYRKEVK